MNTYLVVASILAVLIGLVHSFLGEKLIFSKLRSEGIVPTNISPPLKERHVRILWATWHIVSFLGFGIAALLYWLALPSTNIEVGISLKLCAAVPMFCSALLVLGATKGKHPGWVGLLLVSVFVSIS